MCVYVSVCLCSKFRVCGWGWGLGPLTTAPCDNVGFLSSSQVRSLARTDEARGLLWLLEEEALVPGATEDALLERLFSYYGPREGDKKGRCHLWATYMGPVGCAPGPGLTESMGLGGPCPDDPNLASPTLRPEPPPAQQQTTPFSPGPQPRHQLGGVQRSWLAELHQAEPGHPERPPAPAGLPEVRIPLTLSTPVSTS